MDAFAGYRADTAIRSFVERWKEAFVAFLLPERGQLAVLGKVGSAPVAIRHPDAAPLRREKGVDLILLVFLTRQREVRLERYAVEPHDSFGCRAGDPEESVFVLRHRGDITGRAVVPGVGRMLEGFEGFGRRDHAD